MVVREPPGRLPDGLWRPPAWLLPHQPAAAARLCDALHTHGVALLADETGLGKTWTALAVATRYRRVTLVVPAVLREQWRRTAQRVAARVGIVSHERLSRGGTLDASDLLVVDEAHRFRNPATRRYDRLARAVRGAHVLLLSATPVVNGLGDLAALLRLVLPAGAIDIRPLLVARSAAQAGLDGLPAVCDHRIDLPRLHLDPIVAAIHALTFPTFGAVGVALLRRHLLYRLGSSLAAAAETLRRHDRYLEHALSRPVSRRTYRRLADPDDPQLDLLLDARPTDDREISAERRRLAGLRALLAATADPKPDALVGLVRPGTIVFTAATATARVLAARLAWKRVALVTGRGARIASGPLPVGRALDLFAPRARRAKVGEGERADILIATDLASEGLDLQDADAVVHYDLPWTPHRLLQRLGRVARLGSRHARVHVTWFPPPPALDLPHLLGRKEAAARHVMASGLVHAPDDGAGRRLKRGVLRLARTAQRRRDLTLIDALDATLDRLNAGLAIGAERALADVLSGERVAHSLRCWLREWSPHRACSTIHPAIVATTPSASGIDGSV